MNLELNWSVRVSALTGTIALASVTAAPQTLDSSLITQQQCSAQIDIQSEAPGGASKDPDAVRVNAEIDRLFAAALKAAQSPASVDPYHQVTLLGTLAIYDKNLSVGRNIACTPCHTPDTGFTGGVSLLNQTVVARPGSVADTIAKHPAPNARISERKPQTYGYAPFSPILEYDAAQKQFTGGNFWDMRATGFRLGNPAAEQAQGPPTNPLEMGLPDPACVVRRLSQSGSRGLFEQVWCAQSFAVNCPADIEAICSRPGPPPAGDSLPVHLSAVDRGTANATFDHMALSIAAYRLGTGYVDQGVGGFLGGGSNPNQQWAQHAGRFDGIFRTPTLRNVDKRPRPDFVKASMHNGYFKSLKQVVHFYNTRDALPRCSTPLDPRAGEDCWPAPEVTANESKSIGNLGLSDQEENSIVAFLRTLTDGYVPVVASGPAVAPSSSGSSR